MTPDEYKQKCEWLADFYAKAASTGRWMQYYSSEKTWVRLDWGPTMESCPDKWRLKPEPEKAWVVWCKFNGQWEAASFPNAEEAERFATPRKGTIQEITRPEPQ